MVQSVLKPAIQEGIKKGVAIAKLIFQGYTDEKIAKKLKCSEDEIKEARKEFDS